MKKSSLIIAAIIFLGINVGKSQIKIEGTLDSSITKLFKSHTLVVKINDPVKRLLNEEEIIKVHVDSASYFRMSVNSLQPYTYLSFWINDNRKNGSLTRIHFPLRQPYLSEMYLFRRDDSVVLDIQKNGILSFRGKGSEKLNCQFRIYDTQVKPLSVNLTITDLMNQKRYEEALDFENTALNMGVEIRLKILKSYKKMLNDTVYNMLFLDAIANAEYESIIPLWQKTLSPIKKDSELAKLLIQKYFLKHRLTDYLNDENEPFILNSAYYTEYLFEREWNKYKLFSNNSLHGDSFAGILETIKSNYTGALRDRLLLINLRRLYKYFPGEIRTKMNEVLPLFDNNQIKALSETWYKRFGIAYPFKFEDINGKVHQLSDYKGKIIILDFWFSGCIPCMHLNTAMHPVVQKYKNNDNVVFITVSEDRDREQWLKSIISGKYTAKESINLYTNGLGTNHPMLKFYNFVGAPQQIIVGKNGDIISINPPRPEFNDQDISFEKYQKEKFMDANLKALIAIIDSHL